MCWFDRNSQQTIVSIPEYIVCDIVYKEVSQATHRAVGPVNSPSTIPTERRSTKLQFLRETQSTYSDKKLQ